MFQVLPLRAKREALRFSLMCAIALLIGPHPSVFCQQYWTPLSSPTQKTLNRLCFLDSLKGWVVGDSGTIMKTADGGVTWIQQDGQTVNDIIDISMINERRGWALAILTEPPVNNVLLTTTNGGNEWISLPSPAPERYLFSVRFLDSLHGWTGGTGGALMGTTDGGQSWFRPQVDSSIYNGYTILNIKFFSPLYGYAMGGVLDLGGILWRTTNGGERWSAARRAGSPIYDLCFNDSLEANLVSGEYDIGVGVGRTTDAGVNWEYRDLGVYGDGRAVSFRTPSEGWACLGYAGTVICTFDSGATWNERLAPDTSAMNDVKFTDARHGFMAGAHGIILKYNSPALAVGTPRLTPSFRLLGNYPNPCNPGTRISYEISVRGHVVLGLYDVLGRELAILVDQMEASGSMSVFLDTQHLASGLYFYRLSLLPEERPSGQPLVQTMKLLVIK